MPTPVIARPGDHNTWSTLQALVSLTFKGTKASSVSTILSIPAEDLWFRNT